MQNKLREYRQAAGLSQLELSLDTDIAISNIAIWETGKRPLTNVHAIRRLCHALGCMEEELVPQKPEERREG